MRHYKQRVLCVDWLTLILLFIINDEMRLFRCCVVFISIFEIHVQRHQSSIKVKHIVVFKCSITTKFGNLTHCVPPGVSSPCAVFLSSPLSSLFTSIIPSLHPLFLSSLPYVSLQLPCLYRLSMSLHLIYLFSSFSGNQIKHLPPPKS